MSEFSKNLKKARIKAGYKTAKDFSKELGMKYTTYVAYENRNREATYNVLIKIAKKLNTSPNELIGFPKADEKADEYENGFNNGVTEAFNYLTRAMQSIKDAHMSPYR